MKLILVYGPPATGKLTIAKELVKRTNFKLFHNHTAIDLCFPVLNNKDPRSWKIIQKVRLAVVKEAVKQKVPGIVMTMAYTGEREYIQKLIDIVDGKTYFVRLECDPTTLKKRVGNKSRKAFGKASSKKEIEEWFERHKSNVVITGRKSLVLDTSKLSPKKAADKIVKYIGATFK